MIYVGVVAQSSLVPAELAGMGRPFLPALLLVLIAVRCDATASILWSGLLGFVLDGLSTERLGVQLALAAMLGLGLQLMRSMWKSRRLVNLVATVMVTCLAWRTLGPMTQAVLAGRTVDPYVVLMDAVQDAAWTAAIAAVLLLLGRGLAGQSARARMMVANPNADWGTATR
jgi:rod shape-determining protein MreD